jgi:hypothetical protein
LSKATKGLIEEFGWQLLERDISFVPIAPGTKRPGKWSKQDGWEGMGDWTRYTKRRPTEIELSHWTHWPDAGLGVVLGEISNLTCIDKDYDLPGGEDALQRFIPDSIVSKRGEKGWTRFYQFNGERSCSFDVNDRRVLDILSTGRQTVIPPTMHPSGCHYVWTSHDTLFDLTSTRDLPKLPDTWLDDCAAFLEPWQTEKDKRVSKKQLAPPDSQGAIDTSLSLQAQYFRDLNAQALARLDEWVPKLIPDARQDKDGWRCRAAWRNAQNPNVGIHPSGIRDWGGGYGMTPIDIVMYVGGLTFGRAAETLRACLPMNEPEPIILTVGGAVAGIAQPQASSKVAAPTIMPWQQPGASKAERMREPVPLMLPSDSSTELAPALPRYLSSPPGVLSTIAEWITATAPKAQPELSLAAAIALCSVVMGRTYRSQYGNRTSLYLITVAKSTEGKEHPQASIERLLAAAELPQLIGGSGYTSAGAVHSALLKSPAHLATIDELGKLLKHSRQKGNSHSEAAIDKLVEAYGRLDGVMRPPSYSTMTMSNKQVDTTSMDKVVHNPAITLLGATTPGTFYAALTTDLVMDGFLGRCIVVESKQPRQLTRFVHRTDPPESAVAWCKDVHVSGAAGGNLADVNAPSMPAFTADLPIGESCLPLMQAMEAELNAAKDEIESAGLDVVLGRTLEKAMRLSMIAAKARDARAREVTHQDMQWAMDYVRHYDMALVRAIARNHHANEFDGAVKKLVQYVLDAPKAKMPPKERHRLEEIFAAKAAPRSLILKRMHMPAREFTEVVSTAVEMGVISVQSGGPMGYAGDLIYVLEEPPA